MGKNHQKQPLVGAHLSISKGLADVFNQADLLGCTTLQLFTKSGRQWHAKPLTEAEIEPFKIVHAAHHYMPVVAHTSYLINIGSPDDLLAEKSRTALAEELLRCEQLGIQYLVLHPGAHINTNLESCLKRIANNLLEVLKKVPGKTMILLETTAGQGSAVGSKFEELGTILTYAKHNLRLGICLDTCHVFAAGYDFRTPEGYKTLWQQFDTQIGKQYLKVIHMNDSATPLGSHVDRHADIGSGKIGLESFRFIMKDPTLADIPKILETPKDSIEDDARNLDTLRKLI